jgi:cytoplasmic iron level regulating protein YaaA (DUF328/UPF0246 family)
MKIVLSPAKTLDFERELPTNRHTTPAFLDTTEKLNKKLARLSKKELAKLMDISPKLAELNYERYKEFDKEHKLGNSRPSIFTFDGDVYSGLEAYSIPIEKLDRLQETVRILSGMYGILKPLDLMQPYRLEMGTSIGIGAKNDLYQVWSKKVTDALNKEMVKDELFINLASKEYFKVVDTKKIKTPVITPVFKDLKNGKLKIISFFAKKARGSMVKYIIENDINSIEGIKGFDYDGYRYSEKESTKKNELLFTR